MASSREKLDIGRWTDAAGDACARHHELVEQSQPLLVDRWSVD